MEEQKPDSKSKDRDQDKKDRMKKKQRPLIIKRIEDGGHGGHHGGAWKVAYADFVTAMMAFFLLLWILNAVDEERLQGLSDYFAPTIVIKENPFGSDVISGQTIGPEGILSSSDSVFTVLPTPKTDVAPPGEQEDVIERERDPSTVVENGPQANLRFAGSADAGQGGEAGEGEILKLEQEDLVETLSRAMDELNYERIEREILEGMQADGQLRDLLPNLLFQRREDGLYIQIVDKDTKSMFVTGSERPLPETERLVRLITRSINGIPNKIQLTGHTDTAPYQADNTMFGYGNWELSSGRANAIRRIMIDANLDEQRVLRVSGVAFRELLYPSDPLNPSNRRVSLFLKNSEPGDMSLQDFITALQDAGIPLEEIQKLQ